MKQVGLVVLVAGVVWGLAGEGVYGQLAAPVKRPNILMIVADDMNWDSPGCFGAGRTARPRT